MKKRRLTLNRETLRELDKDRAHGVAGGTFISQPACNTLGFTACITQCFTACGQRTCGPCAIEPDTLQCAPTP